jgi:hypothetical protein
MRFLQNVACVFKSLLRERLPLSQPLVVLSIGIEVSQSSFAAGLIEVLLIHGLAHSPAIIVTPRAASLLSTLTGAS